MLGEEIGKEESHVEYKLLTGVISICIRLSDVGGWGDHSIDGGHDHGEKDNELGVVLRANF